MKAAAYYVGCLFFGRICFEGVAALRHLRVWGYLCPAQTECSLCAGHWSGALQDPERDSLPQCTQDSFPRRHIGQSGYFPYKACLLPQNNEATFLGVAFKCFAVLFQFTFLAIFSLPSFQHTVYSNYMIAAIA